MPSHEGCRLPLMIGFLPLLVDPIQWQWPASLHGHYPRLKRPQDFQVGSDPFA